MSPLEQDDLHRTPHSGDPDSTVVNVSDFERLASRRLSDGVLDQISAGAGDERTLRRNVEAFQEWELLPRVLVDVSSVDTATEVLGVPVSMPVILAPLALQRTVHPDGELATARAAATGGVIMCVSAISSSSLEEIAAAAPAGRRWFQLYALRDRGLTAAIADAAAEGGFDAMVLTVDTPVVGKRDRALRSASGTGPPLPLPIVSAFFSRDVTAEELAREADASLTWADVERLAEGLPMPLVLKGVLSAADAARACEAGVAGIVVSNHGGRQLDGVPATIDVLPEIVEATGGRIAVFLDGGVRRGIDFLIALALGARAVLVGRPVAWSLAVDGEAGVAQMLALLKEELELALALIGAPSIAELSPDLVRRRRGDSS